MGNRRDEHEDLIHQLYQRVLLREPDPEAMVNGIRALQGGVTIAELVATLINSAEFAQKVAPELIENCLTWDSGRKIFFMHVPKTAGTSVRVLLEQATRMPVLYSYHGFPGWPTRQTESYSEMWPLLIGHQGVSRFPRTHQGFSVLRETRSRVLSFIRFRERKHGNPSLSTIGVQNAIKRLKTSALDLTQWFIDDESAPRSPRGTVAPSVLDAMSAERVAAGVDKGLSRFTHLAWAHDQADIEKKLSALTGHEGLELGIENRAPASARLDQIELSKADVELLEEIRRRDRRVIDRATSIGLVEKLDSDTEDDIFRHTAERLGFKFR